jgi:hypothetical protein
MSQASKSHREKQRNMAAPSPQTGEVNCLPNAIIHCALNIGDFLDKADINTLTRLLPFDNARFRSLNHRLNQFPDQESARGLGLLATQMDCILALFKWYPGMNMSIQATYNEVELLPEENLSFLSAVLQHGWNALIGLGEEYTAFQGV